MESFFLSLRLVFDNGIFLSYSAIPQLLLYKSCTIFQQNWLKIFPIFDPDNISCSVQPFLFLQVDVYLFPNELFPSELSALIRACILSDWTHHGRKLYFTCLLRFYRSYLVNVSLDYFCYYTHVIILCIYET